MTNLPIIAFVFLIIYRMWRFIEFDSKKSHFLIEIEENLLTSNLFKQTISQLLP